MPDNSLLQILDKTIDKTDPTQKAIGLLAALVDNKFNDIEKNINSLKEKINAQDEVIDKLDHTNGCPFGMEREIKSINALVDKRIAEINLTIQPLTFLDRYPKLALLMILGLVSLCGLGLERLIDLFK